MLTLFIIVGGFVVLLSVGYGVTRICVAKQHKAPYFKNPLQVGWLRVVAHDEVGGAELTRVIGDYPNFDDAREEAARQRAAAELRDGRTGTPTKFFIYDHTEAIVGDWTGRRIA